MTVVLDTSVLVDHLRGFPPAVAALRALWERGEVLAASVLTRVELMVGTTSRQERAYREISRLVEWVPVTLALADRAGTHAASYGRSHGGIDPVDVVIAATVESLGASLWTRNVRHFPMYPDLRPPYEAT